MPLVDIFERLSAGEIAYWHAFELLQQNAGRLPETPKVKPVIDADRAKRRAMAKGLREFMTTLGERGEREDRKGRYKKRARPE